MTAQNVISAINQAEKLTINYRTHDRFITLQDGPQGQYFHLGICQGHMKTPKGDNYMVQKHGTLPSVQCWTREEEKQIATTLLEAQEKIVNNTWFKSTTELLKTW